MEQTDSCQKGGCFGRLGEKVERIKQKKKKTPQEHGHDCGDYQRERGYGEVEEGKGVVKGDGRRHNLS